MDTSYQEQLVAAVLDETRFVRLTMKGVVRGPAVPWIKIVVRPVLVKNKHHIQISRFDARQDTTKNYQGDDAMEAVREVVAIPFSAIRLETTDEDTEIQITKKGKVFVQRRKTEGERTAPDLRHNRTKNIPLPADKPDAFLQAIGVMNEHGQVKPAMRDKFAQINEFLKLVEATGHLDTFERRPLNIVDCGCGSALLSFATAHYLNDVRGIPARLTGIDTNDDLIRKDGALAEQIARERVCFVRSPIIDYQPDAPVDIVLALHACDTATDEVIAQTVRWDAPMLIAIPCCHHDLNQQIASPVFRPVLRHGILKERLADILTDTFRALALRIMGYRTDVIEFVSSEHTARNLMIRAIKATPPGDARAVREYNDLTAFWQVTPYVEKLLGPAFTDLLGDRRPTVDVGMGM
jgi:SAM-dependent methyltransferase